VGFLPFAFLSYAGTGILVAAIIAGFVMGFRADLAIKHYMKTLYVVRYPILTITAMLSLASVTSASGADGTLGLAFASTGALYPFFGTMLGWLGWRRPDRTRQPTPCSADFRWSPRIRPESHPS